MYKEKWILWAYFKIKNLNEKKKQLKFTVTEQI